MTTQEIIEGLTNILNYCRYHENAPALREAIEMLKCSEIPNSSDERTDKRTETHECDLIDRQEAIDGRISIQRTNGVEIYCDEAVPVGYLKRLPSAQPDIIRCKDCKHWDKTWTNDWAKDYHYCPVVDGVCKATFYCADAERRTDALQ